MFAAGKSKKSHKKTLHKKRQDSTKKPVTVGLVHANWCGHCQSLMPEWDKMEHNIKNNPKLDTKCNVVKIESQDINNELPKYESMINEKIPVDGYPTIFLIKNNKMEKYDGERSSKAIGGWVAGAINGHVGGKKHAKTRKTSTMKLRKASKQNCKSCKKFNLFKLW
jgi:thiol-disulfide isomerase/thioredoxin